MKLLDPQCWTTRQPNSTRSCFRHRPEFAQHSLPRQAYNFHRRHAEVHSKAAQRSAAATGTAAGQNGAPPAAVPAVAPGSSTTAITAAQAVAAPLQQLTATLLVQCPDQPGVVAALAQLLYGLGANILQSDQFTDSSKQPATYFQRIEFDYSKILVGAGNREVLERAVSELARRFDMTWRMQYRDVRKRVAVLVSKLDHCLYDILIRHRAGELECDIPIIVSNHATLEHIAATFELPFRHLPLDREHGGKEAQEAELEKLLAEHDIDVVVLARYMQVLSPGFCDRHRDLINIHHSFLPAFEGAKPYHRAHERGVKIIGATSHYVTSELDSGPIIEQDVVRTSHRDSVQDLVRKGRDLERQCLARALRWHLQDRILVDGANRTVVFE